VTADSIQIIARIVHIRRTVVAGQTAGNHSGGVYSRHSFVEGEVGSTRQVVGVVGAPYQRCPAWLVGMVLLLNMSTPHVQAVGASGMFDSAVELREGRMAGAAMVAAESDHYRLESQDQHRGRVAAELG
jgi:hypothetical protein